MKRTATTIIAVVSVGLAAASSAQAARWVPGSHYMVTTRDARDFLEGVWDTASCRAIPRFGRRGNEFRVFDCSVTAWERDVSIVCKYRYRTIKGSRPGYFKLKRVLDDGCF